MKDPAAVALGKRRWASVSREERSRWMKRVRAGFRRTDGLGESRKKRVKKPEAPAE